MIGTLICGVLRQRPAMAVITVVLLSFGLDAARKLSLDAFPDVTNAQVQIATEASRRSPEEVGRFVTVPVEMAMTGLSTLAEMRSFNKSGLSSIMPASIDKTDVYFTRQLVLERLIKVQSRMPAGATSVLGPVPTGLGEVYQHTLDGPNDGDKALPVEELTRRRIAQDWVVRLLLRLVPSVAEINSQSGYGKQYQVFINPERLCHHNMTAKQMLKALAINNANLGDGVLPHPAEQHLIHGMGLVYDINDIGAIVLKEVNDIPLTVRDVIEVKIGVVVRAGTVARNGVMESVGDVVMMTRGGNAKEAVARVQDRVKAINNDGMLPDGLEIVSYYERSELVDSTLQTVIKVLAEGVVPMMIALLLFLDDIHSSLIVIGVLILTSPLTFMAVNRFGILANLMSLGGLTIAIGLMVDDSMVVMENALVHLAKSHDPSESHARITLHAMIEVATPVIFGMGAIILMFLPPMVLEGMESKMFAPLAFTIAIVLFFSPVLLPTLTPVLSSYLFKPKVPEHAEGEYSDDPHAEHDAYDTQLIRRMKKPYLRLLELDLNNGHKTVIVAVTVLLATGALMPFLGAAFIPETKGGSAVPGINRAPSISLGESVCMETEATHLVMQTPDAKLAVSGVGRGEPPTDLQGRNESTPIVSLKPRDEWPKGWNQDGIVEAMRKALQVLPGVQIVTAQPIFDCVDEMMTGVCSDAAIKVFGDDLNMLRKRAEAIAKVAQDIQDAQDMYIERATGQQYLQTAIDRQAIVRHDLNTADVHNVIGTTIDGKEATEIFEGGHRFSAVIRLPNVCRGGVGAIRNLIMAASNGVQMPTESIARIGVTDSSAQINRELGKRRAVVGVNVYDCDLGGFVAELQAAVAQKVKLPEGYCPEWGGQLQNVERAMRYPKVIVLITVAVIFFLFFLLFSSYFLYISLSPRDDRSS